MGYRIVNYSLHNTSPFMNKIVIVLCNVGEVAEWLKAHAWKACGRESVSRVRISPSPPFISRCSHFSYSGFIICF